MTAVLFVLMPQGFFPDPRQIGMILGISEAGQDVSPDEMRHIQRELSEGDRPRSGRGRFRDRSSVRATATRKIPAAFVIGAEAFATKRTASASQMSIGLRSAALPSAAGSEAVPEHAATGTESPVGGPHRRGQVVQYVIADPDLARVEYLGTAPDSRNMKKASELAHVASDAQNLAPLLTVTITATYCRRSASSRN